MVIGDPKVCANRFYLDEILVERPNCRIYRACDSRLGDREVVVKIFEDHPKDTLGLAQDFLAQMRVFRRSSHPSLCPIVQSGEEGDRFFCVMERLPGPTVKQFFEDAEHQLDVDQVLELITEVAYAVREIHELGLAHGHIDPRALMFKRDILCLAGFYPAVLSKAVLGAKHGQRSLFEPAYTAPEMYGVDVPLDDPRIDTYSLTAVLFEFLTGQAPPRVAQAPLAPGDTERILLVAHEVNPHISQPLSDALELGLASNPADRFQNIDDFIDAINGGRQSVKNPLIGMAGLERELTDSENIEMSMSSAEIARILIARRAEGGLERVEAAAGLRRELELEQDGNPTNGIAARVQTSRILIESSGECLADRIELIDSLFRRMRNLIEQRKLEAGEALLWPSCRQVFTFFRGCPIDVVFCSADGVVLDTATEMSPWRASRRFPGAAFVVQLPPGQLGQSGVFTGDRLIFDYSVNNSIS